MARGLLATVAVACFLGIGNGQKLIVANDVYPRRFNFGQDHPIYDRVRSALLSTHLDDPYSDVQTVKHEQRRDGAFGNFDPNAFNSQIGANFNPNALNGGVGTSGGGASSGGGTSGGMFNPNAMMGGGSSSMGGTGGGMPMFNPNSMSGGGGSGTSSGTTSSGTSTGTGTGSTSSSGASSTGGSGGFDPNSFGSASVGTPSGSGASAFGGSFNPNQAGGGSATQSQNGPSQSGSSTMGGQITGGSTGGGGGSSGSFIPKYDPSNSVNTGASYNPNAAGSPGGGGGSAPSFANNMGMNAQQKTPGGTSAGTSSSSSSGSNSTSGGSASSSTNPAASFGSSGGSTSGGTPQTGSGSASTGSGSAGGGGSSSGGFDPVATNSQATAGFNPLNPMMGKDMSVAMGPQTQTGGSNPGGFDPGKMNAQLGQNGMSMNMFGGAGGNTNLNKADASSLMTGAQGMMSGSNAILGGGNAISGGAPSSGATSGGATSGGTSSGAPSSGSSAFDPNAGNGGSGSGSGSASGSGGGMFNMGGSTSGSGSTSGGGMNMFNPNAMMGGGSGSNPMMPGGGTNPLMPGGSMTGSSTGTRQAAGSPVGSSPLDPMGAMTGAAKNFTGGTNLVNPMGFMDGGGLSGSMANVFSPAKSGSRSAPVAKAPARRDVAVPQWQNRNLMRSLAGQAYNQFDTMGFISEGSHRSSTQDTDGGGANVPRYDPNRFSYSYAGMPFRSTNYNQDSSSQRSFNPQYINNAMFAGHLSAGHPNTDKQPKDNEVIHVENKLLGNTNGKITTSLAESITNIEDNPDFDGLHVKPESTNGEFIPQEAHQELPESILNLMRQEPSYSGLPGMLGTGSQSQASIVLPGAMNTSRPESQYNTGSMMMEQSVPRPVYTGQPGMFGVDSQRQDSFTPGIFDKSIISQQGNTAGADSDRLYSGYPGMMGIQELVQHSVRIQDNMHGFPSNPITDNTGHSAPGQKPENTRGDGGPIDGQGIDSNTSEPTGRTGLVLNANNWNGEWVGGSNTQSVNQDWSGDWSKNWPGIPSDRRKLSENNKNLRLSGNEATTDKEKVTENNGTIGEVSSPTSATHKSPSSTSSWDGSWPGKADILPPSESGSTAGNSNTGGQESIHATLERFTETMAEIQELVGMMNNIGHRHSPGDNSGATRSYSDLVGDWARDLKS